MSKEWAKARLDRKVKDLQAADEKDLQTILDLLAQRPDDPALLFASTMFSQSLDRPTKFKFLTGDIGRFALLGEWECGHRWLKAKLLVDPETKLRQMTWDCFWEAAGFFLSMPEALDHVANP